MSNSSVNSNDTSTMEATNAAAASNTAESIIKLEKLNVVYKTRTGSLIHPNKVHAVRDLDLQVAPGEVLGIVGESGCGKSTTANVMCGLQEPTSGRVLFKGEDVTRRTPALRRRMGRVISVIFQDPATALNARMSVHDQLIDPLNIHKVGTPAEREKHARELIGMVGLPTSVMGALPGQLSGGQRQRVAIARALSLKPDAIIADEPTSALDVSVRAQILNLLTDLRKDLGLAMVFISHDIQTVRYISDTICVMNKGVCVERGTATEVFEHPKDDYTRKLLGAAPSLLHPDPSVLKA
ncbi:ABC transporter ATP-binding protein [Cryptobacterium curtum]|uniref:ABC transporter ATP-binding protein n=1 Tax=Cryptobacterium curtum TaxID=84163 RepID=UPI00248E26D9|nr:dipeptide/oligopeptide/nickel ABC transporter ATP-binding protein [Cryptobacterium curtum]